MTDQTTTDDEHVCKPGASGYYCPTSGETESDCHGGFDVCCDRPDLHQPTDEACQRLAERLDAVRATAEAWIRPTMSAPTRAAGEHLLRVLSAASDNRTDSDTVAPLPATTNHDTDAGFELRGDTEIRAAVLREAADRAEIVALRLRLKHDYGAANGAYEVMADLSRVADETAATETVPCLRPEPHPAHSHSGLRKGVAVHGRCPGQPAAGARQDGAQR